MKKLLTMRRVTAVLLMMLMMLVGCTGTSGQSNSMQNDTQMLDISVEEFVETELPNEVFLETEYETSSENEIQTESEIETQEEYVLDENGSYTSKEEVAAYLHYYGKLPSNYITKKEAKKLGWVNTEGNLSEVAPGKSIGGDYFGNYEGQLPEKDDRDYYECDINTDGSYRGAERIVFSDDGLIYYTADHYDSFELLYGDE